MAQVADTPERRESPAPREFRGYSVHARLTALAAVLLAPVGLFLLYAFEPSENSGLFPQCVWYSITRLHCPGCGTTRALHAVLHGQFLQSLAYNAFALIYVPILVWYGTKLCIGVIRNKQVRYRDLPTWTFQILLAVMVSYWVLRNIPVYPLTLLAPHELGTVPMP